MDREFIKDVIFFTVSLAWVVTSGYLIYLTR